MKISQGSHMIGNLERRQDRPQRIKGVIHLLREEKEQAERACHDKSCFLAAASHDLRQPIHALGLYVAELRRKILDEEQQHLVGQVERSVDAIATLIDDLLDISRLDAGGVVPQKQPCSVTQLLDRIMANFQMMARTKNIRLVIHPFNGFVSSDPVMLERIVMNLVSNALRYTHPNGTVLIACRRRGAELLIEVRDNGIGIDESNQANIFGEYVQLKPTTQGGQKGLGLGLSIVDRLVRLLGHELELHSAPNRGATFALRLNLTASLVETGCAALEMSALSLKGKKLLIVDNDGLVLDGMSKLLCSWGCEVTAACSLMAVQRRIVKHASWDMVISDELLEENSSGMEIFRMVRQDQDIPCILISADIDIMKSAQTAGHHVLRKPVKPAKLRSLMQFLLTSQIEILALNA